MIISKKTVKLSWDVVYNDLIWYYFQRELQAIFSRVWTRYLEEIG